MPSPPPNPALQAPPADLAGDDAAFAEVLDTAQQDFPDLPALRDLDLNLFRVFEAVYSCGTVTAAANRLGQSQPAVSGALGRLREVLGDELFTRQGRGLAPTQMARSLIHPVRGALSQIQAAITEWSRFDPLTSNRKFKLSMSDRMEYELLPRVMARVQRLAPGVRVRNRLLPSDKSSEALRSGQIDFAVDPPENPGLELVHVPLVDEEVVCAVRPGHPLLARAQDFSLQDYLSLSHILVSNREPERGLVDLALDRLNSRRRIGLVCQHRLATPWILRDSDMALTCERSFAEHHRLGLLPMPFPVARTCLHLFWHENQDGNAGHIWMRNLLLEAAKAVFPAAEGAPSSDLLDRA